MFTRLTEDLLDLAVTEHGVPTGGALPAFPLCCSVVLCCCSSCSARAAE